MVELIQLRQIPLFMSLHDDQLEFVKLGRERWVNAGDVLAHEGDPSGPFWVMLEGEIQCTKKVGDRQVPWTSLTPPSYFGHELILLEQPYFSTLRATATTQLLEFDTAAFWKMIELCPAITRELFIVTAQRTQELGAASMQAQKLVSLGSLTSGIAHELRLVAATGRQAVETLQELFKWFQPVTMKLNAQRMQPEQQQFLLDLQQTVLERMMTFPQDLNPQAWRSQEETLVAWLNDRNIPYPTHFASVLIKAGLDVVALDAIADAVPAGSLCAVLAWLKTTLKSLNYANEVEHSTQRIAQLVQAAKDYAYLDQAPLQEMDIHDGIENTLTMLNHRLVPGITVVREYDCTLPPICVYGRDLNQVWTHLIDNAIDAVAGQGQITIRTTQVPNCRVLVEIIDTGAGIPAEVQPFIFDQFFTTKGLDQGTGLGLPIAYRVVVDQHQGDIRVASAPGETRFQVYLPMDLVETQRPSAQSQVA